MQNTKYNVGDKVKILEDEILDGALEYDYDNVHFNKIYIVSDVNDFFGVVHFQLKNEATDKIVYFKKNIPYAFIEVEIKPYAAADELSNEKINALEKSLEDGERIAFKYNGLFYEIFESVSSDGYIVNVYSSAEKIDGEYFEDNLVDGGLCSGGAEDAILFML